MKEISTMSSKTTTASRAAAIARCELRRSNAATRHVSKRHKRTRAVKTHAAIRDFL